MRLDLAAWRRARNKSQKEMADVVGVHVNTYLKWESNPGEMRLDSAYKIANYLGISVDDIFLGSDITKTDISQEKVV